APGRGRRTAARVPDRARPRPGHHGAESRTRSDTQAAPAPDGARRGRPTTPPEGWMGRFQAADPRAARFRGRTPGAYSRILRAACHRRSILSSRPAPEGYSALAFVTPMRHPT